LMTTSNVVSGALRKDATEVQAGLNALALSVAEAIKTSTQGVEQSLEGASVVREAFVLPMA